MCGCTLVSVVYRVGNDKMIGMKWNAIGMRLECDWIGIVFWVHAVHGESDLDGGPVYLVARMCSSFTIAVRLYPTEVHQMSHRRSTMRTIL